MFSLECAFPPRSSVHQSTSRIIVGILLPFALTLIYMLLWTIYSYFSSGTRKDLLISWGISVLSVFYFKYLDMTRDILRILDCADVDKMSNSQSSQYAIARSVYWVEDVDLKCHEGQHMALLFALCIPGLLLVTIGMPLWLLINLICNKEKLKDGSMLRVYGVLYKSYRDGCEYWEVIILAREGLLAAVKVFTFTLKSNLQALLSMAILVVTICVHLWARPFIADGCSLNRMESLSLGSSIMAFFAGLLFNYPNTSDAGKTVISVVIIFSLMSVFIYLVIELAFHTLKKVVAFFDKASIQVDANASTLTKVRLLLSVVWNKAIEMLSKYASSAFKMVKGMWKCCTCCCNCRRRGKQSHAQLSGV